MNAPWFEDLEVGDEFNDVPAVTLTAGHMAVHQALFGDRLRLSLDHVLSKRVTGREQPVIPTSLVSNIAIGQSTIASQRVMGNLFYRGLVFRRPVYLGDTLTTRTRIEALRQNSIRPGRPASGMVVLQVDVRNQNDEVVMLFWRCPMIPCRDPRADTGKSDDFDFLPELLDEATLEAAVPDWDLTGLNGSRPNTGERTEVEARDTVTLAPELVRLTLNLAMTHTDASRSIYGKRLVYGGHTISMAAAQLSRVLPSMATTLGWYHCNHVAPVFEGDMLSSVVTVDSVAPVSIGTVAVVHVETFAERGDQAPEQGKDVAVLDWRLAVLLGPEKQGE